MLGSEIIKFFQKLESSEIHKPKKIGVKLIFKIIVES